MCICFLLESSFALDGAEFHGKRIQLLILQSRKGLPGYTLVLAKGIDAVPVRGVDTHLLHQLQASAALFLLPLHSIMKLALLFQIMPHSSRLGNSP